MSAASVGSLKSLPVQTHPRFSVSVCIDRLIQCLLKTERALAPPVWKKLLGGVSRDHARAVAAACKADARIVRTAMRDIVTALSIRAVVGGDRFPACGDIARRCSRSLTNGATRPRVSRKTSSSPTTASFRRPARS